MEGVQDIAAMTNCETLKKWELLYVDSAEETCQVFGSGFGTANIYGFVG